ncbi:MAG: hypothetical protein JRJ65_16750 [Deltaproteobacteria bacterium]|nr:hypothetical protein [Deltaproteobacteria bacterium]
MKFLADSMLGRLAKWLRVMGYDTYYQSEQLQEMKQGGNLTPDRSNWFSRCLICNVRLKEAEAEKARESVPEYVLYENLAGIRFCPSCSRYFWPGSHRERMIRQLEEWGL